MFLKVVDPIALHFTHWHISMLLPWPGDGSLEFFCLGRGGGGGGGGNSQSQT